MVDDDDAYTYDEEDGMVLGKVLLVIDIQSGDISQRVDIDLQGGITAILLDGDEIYIAGFDASKVIVLRYAGSEA